MAATELREKTVSGRRKYKLEFVLTLLVAFLAVLIDRVWAPHFLRLSVTLSEEAQVVPLATFSFVCSVFIFGGLFLVVFVLFMTQTCIERNIVMVIGAFSLVYAQAFLKLLFAEGRPIFFAARLQNTGCICDYGKPSGHALCSAGLLLFIFHNLQTNSICSPKTLQVVKAFFWTIFVAICVSRVYLAAHSFNQVILGGIFGALVFYCVHSYEDFLLKSVVIPITSKTQMRERRAVYDLIGGFVVTNFALLFLWSLRRHRFEHLDNDFFSFKNCFECLFDGRANFSNKIVSDSLNFNALFGVLFGAYLFPGKGVYWVGFGPQSLHRHIVFRVLFLLACLVPLVFSILWRTDNLYLEIFKNIGCSVFSGYLVSNPLAKFSIWLAAASHDIDRRVLLQAEEPSPYLDNRLHSP